MEWIGRSSGVILALVLISLGLFIVTMDGAPMEPFEAQERSTQEDPADLTWWWGVGTVALGVAVLVVVWRRFEPGD